MLILYLGNLILSRILDHHSQLTDRPHFQSQESPHKTLALGAETTAEGEADHQTIHRYSVCRHRSASFHLSCRLLPPRMETAEKMKKSKLPPSRLRKEETQKRKIEKESEDESQNKNNPLVSSALFLAYLTLLPVFIVCIHRHRQRWVSLLTSSGPRPLALAAAAPAIVVVVVLEGAAVAGGSLL